MLPETLNISGFINPFSPVWGKGGRGTGTGNGDGERGRGTGNGAHTHCYSTPACTHALQHHPLANDVTPVLPTQTCDARAHTDTQVTTHGLPPPSRLHALTFRCLYLLVTLVP